MKISYLLTDFGNTGGSIVLYNFMDNLVKRGHEVYAISPNKRIKWKVGIWEDIINENHSKYSLHNLLKFIGDITKNSEKITKKLIKNWIKSDITISTHCFTAYACYFLSEQTVPFYHMQHWEELFFDNYEKRLIARESYYLPLLKIVNSSWLSNIIKKQYNQDTLLLNPGINLSVFKPYKDINKKYTDKKEWTILSYGNDWIDWKGFEDAAESVSIARNYLEKKGIKLIWKVYGFSKPSIKYNAEFEYLGKVFGSDLAKLYSDVDIVLLASWYESFPLPPIEAMACGTLIITTQFGTEDYVFDNENGLVSLPRKTNEIAEKIIFSVENPFQCLNMVRTALDTVKDYNWEKRTDDLEKIFENAFEFYSKDNSKFIDKLITGNFEGIYDKFE